MIEEELAKLNERSNAIEGVLKDILEAIRTDDAKTTEIPESSADTPDEAKITIDDIRYALLLVKENHGR